MATKTKNEAAITKNPDLLPATNEPQHVVFALPANLVMKRIITLPSLVIKGIGQSATIMIKSPFRESKVEGKLPGEKKATICNVVDMEDGKQYIYLVPAVVMKNLEQEYPPETEEGEPAYVGKMFYIQNLGKRKDDQRYNDFGICEIEAGNDE